MPLVESVLLLPAGQDAQANRKQCFLIVPDRVTVFTFSIEDTNGYSAFRKYSDAFIFFTFSYVAAVC